MSLIKDKELETGVVGSYFKILNVGVSRNPDFISFTVALYLSKEAKEADKQPIKVFNMHLPCRERDLQLAHNGRAVVQDTPFHAHIVLQGEVNLLSKCYEYMKTLPEFADAQDA